MIDSNDIYENAKAVIDYDSYNDLYKKELINNKLEEYTRIKLEELNIYLGEDTSLKNMLLVLDATIDDREEFFKNYTYFLLGVMAHIQKEYIPWYISKKDFSDSPIIEFSSSGNVKSLISSKYNTNPVDVTLFTLDTFNNVFLDEKIYKSNKVLTKNSK